MTDSVPTQNGAVTYQTYKSKRASTQHVRASSFTDHNPPLLADGGPRRPLSMLGSLPTVNSLAASQPAVEPVFQPTPPRTPDKSADLALPPPAIVSTPAALVSPPLTVVTPPATAQSPISESPDASSSSSLPPSPSSARPPSVTARPGSTFRRLPAKSTAPHTPSLLSPARAVRTASSASSQYTPSLLRSSDVFDTSAPSTPTKRPDSSLSTRPALSPTPSTRPELSPAPSVRQLDPPVPSPGSSRIASPTPPAVYQSPRRPPATTPGSSTSSARPAPYRPGFQPKGVYRPRTDEFIAARSAARDVGRIEQQRLERRLDKLVDLHFSPGPRPKPSATSNGRRASSFFETLDIKSASPSELLRGVLSGGTAESTSKNDIRNAEQAITPWEDDALASSCRLCSASFHPITNRKHHCRLCGRIICALPPKAPQRPQTCSLLFVADPRTGAIEEVGEGVDYGVKKRGAQLDKKAKADEDKFLKGVRICRECRPTLLRKQYAVEQAALPTFARLYEAMLLVEKELEDSLPAFQEMLLALNNNPEVQSSEAKAARKRLLDAFADYDALSKRIIGLPCAPGSSQERVQTSIRTRANLFLQQHMFPLQALPRPSTGKKKANGTGAATAVEDVDAKLAMALQPLLEQEKLLESMVEEARSRRKFEDARTIQTSLEEIRVEIDRILESGQVALSG
ncbi:FYVE-domain-containing protein [Exidia glandulosa HHB12029]|uniref:FYVE-domain-containing protein n=1 Tax=Exidia glandulosa HHB12029 TaxID=1314781 RepID=A0A165EBR0_EXIGL|nr:FYVE-domain-containing protein [Exidia glandulosa HHB12029]